MLAGGLAWDIVDVTYTDSRDLLKDLCLLASQILKASISCRFTSLGGCFSGADSWHACSNATLKAQGTDSAA